MSSGDVQLCIIHEIVHETVTCYWSCQQKNGNEWLTQFMLLFTLPTADCCNMISTRATIPNITPNCSTQYILNTEPLYMTKVSGWLTEQWRRNNHIPPRQGLVTATAAAPTDRSVFWKKLDGICPGYNKSYPGFPSKVDGCSASTFFSPTKIKIIQSCIKSFEHQKMFLIVCEYICLKSTQTVQIIMSSIWLSSK